MVHEVFAIVVSLLVYLFGVKCKITPTSCFLHIIHLRLWLLLLLLLLLLFLLPPYLIQDLYLNIFIDLSILFRRFECDKPLSQPVSVWSCIWTLIKYEDDDVRVYNSLSILHNLYIIEIQFHDRSWCCFRCCSRPAALRYSVGKQNEFVMRAATHCYD